MPSPPAHPSRGDWDRHWQELAGQRSWFGWLASQVRRRLLRQALVHYAGRFFPHHGVAAEIGCGTGEASADLTGPYRLGVDFSLGVLTAAQHSGTYHALLAADARQLPFADASLDGIWNFGVMEHFPEPLGVAILGEMRRVLRPNGVLLLFWPPELGSSRWLLGPIEWLRSSLSGRTFRYFPDEVNRLRNRAHARQMLAAADLEPLAVDHTWRDAYIHLVVVARRPP